MEYEKALYRVYERSLDGLRRDQPTRIVGRYSIRPRHTCSCITHTFYLGAMALFVLVVSLHLQFVGQGQCFHDVLKPLELGKDNSTYTASLLDKNAFVSISIERSQRPLLDMDDDDTNTTTFRSEYEFSVDPLVVALSKDFRESHEVQMHNITIPHTCFGSGTTLWLVEQVIGYDTILINQLMYALRSDGQLKNMKTKENWIWTKVQLRDPENLIELFSRKFSVFVYSLFAFCLISTVTALVVRILISSGVAVMFPFFFLLRSFGWHQINLRILTQSYPWLGYPVEHLQALNRPTKSLICAHLAKAVVFYMMYQACQLAWAGWLYNKSVPSGLLMWIYSLMMMWEYFAMIFIRSSSGIRFFPRVALLFFVLFHFYFYSFTYGFFNEALCCVGVAMVGVMVYCVNALEVPALARGAVSFEHPRAFYMELGWPTWSAALPPSFSLFHPLNGEWRGIYEEDDDDHIADDRSSNADADDVAVVADMNDNDIAAGAGGAALDMAIVGAHAREMEMEMEEEDEEIGLDRRERSTSTRGVVVLPHHTHTAADNV